jgi:predicted MFS family arabinose efflux permease
VSIDGWGITTMTLAVTCLVLLTSWGGTTYAWSSPVVLVLAAVAVAAGVVFVLVERRAAQPIIPLHLFAERNFTVPTIVGLVTAVAMFGAIAYLPTYLQMVTGMGAVRSGMLLLSLIAGLGLATVASARVVSRTGRYKEIPVVGCTAVAVALGLLSTLEVGTPLELVGGYLLLLGLGIGCVLQILVVIVQNTFSAAEVGTATAANNFFREVGVSLGSALVGALFTSRLQVLLAERLPAAARAGIDTNTLSPDTVQQLTEASRAAVVSSYNDALTPVLLYLVPLMALSAVALLLVRAVPLATTIEPSDD